MAFLPEEITRLKTLADEMAKLIENKDTSNEAVVAFGRIGNACTRAIAMDAAQTAKRTTRTDNVTKLRTARENRKAAKKGGTPSAQQSPSRQRSS
jgi:hypothetical protein